MSARNRGLPRDHRERPSRTDRARSWRQLRRATRTKLRVSLTEDPELAQTPLPEPHNDARHVRPTEGVVVRRPRRRFGHWKTREWKRRSSERRRRAAMWANPPEASEV